MDPSNSSLLVDPSISFLLVDPSISSFLVDPSSSFMLVDPRKLKFKMLNQFRYAQFSQVLATLDTYLIPIHLKK